MYWPSLNLPKGALAALLLAPVGVAAGQGEHWLTSGFVSHHAEGDYNEDNQGVGYEYRKGQLSYAAGYYRNSLYRDSVYAGIGYRVFDNGTISAGVLGGIVTGYYYPIVPMALPFLQLTAGGLAVMVTVLPAPFIVAAQIKWRF